MAGATARRRCWFRWPNANSLTGDSSSGFNEWLHGQTGHPMGFSQQAWSAAMFLYAEHAVRTGQLPLFDALCAAKPASVVANEVNEMFIHPGGGPG